MEPDDSNILMTHNAIQRDLVLQIRDILDEKKLWDNKEDKAVNTVAAELNMLGDKRTMELIRNEWREYGSNRDKIQKKPQKVTRSKSLGNLDIGDLVMNTKTKPPITPFIKSPPLKVAKSPINLQKPGYVLSLSTRVIENEKEDMESDEDDDEDLSDLIPLDHTTFRYGVYLEYWRNGDKKINRVYPKYQNLKQELLHNSIATITEEAYDKLHQKALKLLRQNPLTAKRVGNNNQVCGIKEGSSPTVEHIIALLVYTDGTYHQREFKKQCRRLYDNEPLESVVSRNSEIYYWSRLLKEMCIFYGETMGDDDVLYTGLEVDVDAMMVFDSLCTRFECPISTTTKQSVAETFAEGGIIIKFKRDSANTKILDVTKYSCFGKDESERLVAGSTLRIVDIRIGRKWCKSIISALAMFEQILNGHFIEGGQDAARTLASLLKYIMEPTNMSLRDDLQRLDLGTATSDFGAFLDDEKYDSDAVLDDLENDPESGIAAAFEECSGFSAVKIRSCIAKHLETRKEQPTPRILCLVFNFLQRMKRMHRDNTLWFNKEELNRSDLNELHRVLYGPRGVLQRYRIEIDTIRNVHNYDWKFNIASNNKNNSPIFRYPLSGPIKNGQSVRFQLQFHRKFRQNMIECSIYLKIITLPGIVKSVQTEMDILCQCNGKTYRRLMRSKTLSPRSMARSKGVVVLQTDDLDGQALIKLKCALKMTVKYKHDSHEDHLGGLPMPTTAISAFSTNFSYLSIAATVSASYR